MDDLLIILGLILLNGIFSMTEVALISARRSKLSADAKRGSRTAATALRLAGEPDRFLSTVQIGITLIGILTGIYSGAALADDMGRLLHQWGVPANYARTIAQVSIVIIVTYLSIVLGELVPKRIGLAAADRVAKAVARPMWLLSVAAIPVVWCLSRSTALIIRLLGISQDTAHVTEDEIKSMIRDGKDAGEVKEVEQDIMQRALALGDRRVSSIMTPKKDVVALRISMDAPAIRRVMEMELHDSYPVLADDNHDEVCGIVSPKELILSIDSPRFSLQAVTGAATYFPETMSAYDALDALKTRHIHCALVCDEFGSMQGVVTLGDILEGLIGAVGSDDDQPEITPRHDNTWLVDGQYPVYDFLSYFDRDDLFLPSDYSTLGGLILEELKHVPVTGEKIIWHDFTFEVVDMDGVRIDKVLVSLPAHGQGAMIDTREADTVLPTAG